MLSRDISSVHVYMYMYLLHTAVVVVGFVQSSYTSSEGDDVRVCVRLEEGHANTALTLQVQTHNGSAQCK